MSEVETERKKEREGKRDRQPDLEEEKRVREIEGKNETEKKKERETDKRKGKRERQTAIQTDRDRAEQSKIRLLTFQAYNCGLSKFLKSALYCSQATLSDSCTPATLYRKVQCFLVPFRLCPAP